MSVFGQQSTTNTEMATGLGQSDYSLTTNYHGSAPLNISPPPPPSSPLSITSDSWLPGTTGVDCKLVHGDRWQEIKGKMSQNIGDVTTSNYGLSSGDYALSEKYHASVVREMYGASFTETYHAGTNSRDYLGHLYEHYFAGHRQHNDIEEFEVRLAKFEIVDTLAFELAHSGVKIAGDEISIAAIGLCLRALEVGVVGDRKEYGGESQKAHAMKQEITLAMKQEIAPIKDNITCLKSAVRVTAINSCPAEIWEGVLLGLNQID